MTSDWTMWNAIGIATHVGLWFLVLFVGFLLLGTLRSLGLLRWRLEQLEATTPSRLGRSGLKIGKKAPEFTLPSVVGGDIALHAFAGRKVLLVFTQSGCGPCQDIMPELNQVGRRGLQVLVVNRGNVESTRAWAAELKAHFPMLVEDGLELSRKYEVLATPFAFLIDEKGVIASKGIISSKPHIGYLLSGAASAKNGHVEYESSSAERAESAKSVSHPISQREIDHV
jgi:methylamine dehydrogenase accessory protein MauD